MGLIEAAVLILFCVAVQGGAFLLLAAIVPFIIHRICFGKKWYKIKVAVGLFVVFLGIQIAFVGYLLKNPIFHCPEEYKSYVSEEEIRSIQSANHGFYNHYILFFPVYNHIVGADEDVIYIKSNYFPFGSVEMEYNGHEFLITHKLFKQ